MLSMHSRARRKGQGQGQRTLTFTPGEVAEITGLSLRTLRRHIAAGRLPTQRVQGHIYITPAGARTWLGHDLPLGKASPSPDWRFIPIPVRGYARITGRSEREVRHLIEKGALRTVRRGGNVFVVDSEVEAALKNGDSKDR